MLPVSAVHHVAIICSDYKRSRDFYHQILGFPIIREVYREERQSYKLDLDVAGHTQIELFSFPSPPERPSRPEAQGLRHLCFAVDELDQAIRYLNEQGVVTEPVRIDPYTSQRFTFFQDPDGLPLELYENKKESE